MKSIEEQRKEEQHFSSAADNCPFAGSPLLIVRNRSEVEFGWMLSMALAEPRLQRFYVL